MTAPPSRRPAGAPRTPLALAAGCALLAACSVLPPEGFPPVAEREVLVFYDFSDGGPRPVRVPASGPNLTVLSLETDPGELQETFQGHRRYLHPTDETLILKVRYRVRTRGEAGEARPLWRAETLFPGATTIHELRRGALSPRSGLDPGASR